MGDDRPFAVILSERVNALIGDMLAERGGGFPASFLLIADYVNADGATCWAFSVAPGQRLFMSLGLRDFASALLDDQMRDTARDADDG